MNPLRIRVETGGTFTDCLALHPDGSVTHAKVLSSGRLRARVRQVQASELTVDASIRNAAGLLAGCRLLRAGSPIATIISDHAVDDATVLRCDRPIELHPGDSVEISFDEDAPVVGARLLTRTPKRSKIPAADIRLATTRATNALLTRSGARVALFITAGFKDILNIGDQTRPDIFAVDIRRDEPLHERTVEVSARIDHHGNVIHALDEDHIRQAARACIGQGVTVGAVVLMHAIVDSAHELRIRDLLIQEGFTHVSCSSELSADIGLLIRARTTVCNAFLAPRIDAYLASVESAFESCDVHVLTSAGGLVSRASFRPKDSLLSGPAGGVIGAASAAARSGFEHLITFDMGGTSTDVARIHKHPELAFEHTVKGIRLAAPAVAVESIAAGGGSVCRIDRELTGGLAVGPMSAGADPGPACYGAGGPLTITDCNLLLEQLDPDAFNIPISRADAMTRADELLAQYQDIRRDPTITRESMLRELIDIADETMAGAIRAISVRKGYDPAKHALVAFGGAAGQHACGVAERIGCPSILIPRDVGLLSAAGLFGARVERIAARRYATQLETCDRLGEMIIEVCDHAAELIRREGLSPRIDRVLIELRLRGQDATIAIEHPGGTDAREALKREFIARFTDEYGYAPPQRPIEIAAIRAIACGPDGEPAPARQIAPVIERHVRRRENLKAGDCIVGPCVVGESHGATFIREGWVATVDEHEALVLTRSRMAPSHINESQDIVTGRLYALAVEMGETLRRASLSVNIKERLDFSCAILDSEGRLIVNAPHLPVHLGALGVTVRAIKSSLELAPGDVAVTNHPAFGGSHLPDVTVVTPVFDAQSRLLAFVANRAHHAEIGGITPGSMPPDASDLSQEGVVIPPMYLVRRGESRLDDLDHLFRHSPYPSRAPTENLADLQAQIASNQRGAQALIKMSRYDGGESLRESMNRLRERAKLRLSEAIAPLEGQTRQATERLDDGSPISVRIDVRNGRVTIDFTGSSATHPRNFNAPAGVVRSAVMYTLRLLINEQLPLNEGVMDAVDLILPRGMLNPPFESDPTRCPPVCAGNVETSQRVVDTLIKALQLLACGQGTMNNVIFGNDTFGCYETVCGGAGATSGASGASGVHTHMTNTRITDPEVLERRYPVRLERFERRTNSGGEGLHRGGDGVIREYRFLEPVTLSFIGQHRIESPFALNGATPGRRGEQFRIDINGNTHALAGVCRVLMEAGERFALHTPGGGGWG